jgi:histidinol dehydrogenase
MSLKIYDIPSAKETILKRSLELYSTALTQSSPALLRRTAELFGEGVTPSQAVARILQSVRENGDEALRTWSQRLERQPPTWLNDPIQFAENMRISPKAIEQAASAISPALLSSLEKAADRIRRFHELQPLPNWETTSLGGRLGQRVTPIEKVGIYVPGGTAPLPSSLLMCAIPAQVAGVQEIILCTPPDPHPSILAAAYICGLETIYQVGGAQAIAAMAYGTQTVPRVDKIVGAGNLFVTLAKQQVYGQVGLDGLAGPTETMIIADSNANPAWVAADLLAQAEHDVLASAILLTPDARLAQAVQIEVGRQMENLERAEIIAQSLGNNSGIVLTPDLETAAQLASEYAPEHLCLSIENPMILASKVRNAGGLFLGERSFEVLGDYVAGPSHIMPTGGTARFASPLNVLDFVKITSLIALDDQTSQEISQLAVEIARAESLTAHASAASQRVRY